MRRTTTVTLCAVSATLPVIATGCVPQDRYDNLLTANRSLQEQIVALEDERDASRASVQRLQTELHENRQSYDALRDRNAGLNTSIDQMESQTDDYMRRIAELELGPLPPDVASALEDLAMARPDVLTFDAQSGMLRFASDFTFDLGSVALKTDAASAISSLAEIINAPAARDLEARIVGHTDNVPIGRAETRRQHPTNLHLAVHRAIAVRDALTGAGVDPVRIQVAGYGEYRPVVPNGRRGAAENRRVEIFLAPLSSTPLVSDRIPTPVSGVPTDEPMK